ncbi:MAG TPA: HAD family hydrolase [Dehalococcoidia bacterium]|nr:HAD family hydrolase [Dehalococcoidia bacterium]
MNAIKVISFDVEGTLVTTDFSYGIWFEAMPESYAQRHGLTIEQAKAVVEEEYRKIGDQRMEWYDINYWVKKFDLGTRDMLMDRRKHRVAYYSEVEELLSELDGNYTLSLASGSPREFLHYLLKDIKSHFAHVFSSTSDYRQLKDSHFYENICREMGVRPHEVIHIGDNWQFDYCAARDAGLQALHLDRSGKRHDEGSLADLSQISTFLR